MKKLTRQEKIIEQLSLALTILNREEEVIALKKASLSQLATYAMTEEMFCLGGPAATLFYNARNIATDEKHDVSNPMFSPASEDSDVVKLATQVKSRRWAPLTA